jgi:hypothetical protein
MKKRTCGKPLRSSAFGLPIGADGKSRLAARATPIWLGVGAWGRLQ